MIPYDTPVPFIAYQVMPDHSILEHEVTACNITNFGDLDFEFRDAPQEVLEAYAHHFITNHNTDGLFCDELFATWQEAWQTAMDDLDFQFEKLEKAKAELTRRQHVLMGSAND